MSTAATIQDASHTTDAHAPWRPRANPWAIAITVTLATFMEVLDTSIANVALPHIASGLGSSQDEATWVLTSYLVANAVILPASSYLTTFIGRKKFYMICVVLFGISSMLCGLAPSLPLLIFFRVLQGAGGGGLAPSEQAILADTFPAEKRGQAMALYGFAVVTAPAIGPTLGGWITDNYDWRWIFFINIPVALVSLFFTARLVEDPPWIDKEVVIAKKRGLNLDYFGFALLAIGFGSLEFILDKGQEDDWFGSRVIVFFLIACAVSLVTLIYWELRQLRVGHRPILNLTLFKRKTFAISFLFMFVLGFALYGTTVLIPQFVQLLLGYTAELAGFAMSPGGFMTMLMMPIVGFLIGKVDVRYLMGFGFFIVGAALLAMHTLNLEVSYGYIAMLRVFQASGLAFLFVPINTISYTGVPRTQNNDVSGLTNLARNIGGSCGVAFVATMLARRTQSHEANMIRNLTPTDPAFQQRIHALSQVFVTHGLAPNITSGGFMAQAYIYQQMFRQAQMLSYLDIIAMLSIGCFLMLPFVALVGKIKKPAGDAPMH
jgi:MFS transporter, DHA2 family, multidrug resistance protein